MMRDLKALRKGESRRCRSIASAICSILTGRRLSSSRISGAGAVRVLFAVVLSIVSDALALAESKYNPYTNLWEDVSPDAVPQLNPVTGHWELASPNSVPKLNPYTHEYQMVPANSILRFNPQSKQWELAPPDADLELNPHTGTWHYVR